MTEAAFFKGSQRPGPNCYDSSPLSLFHLDISTSCNYICEASDAQKCPSVQQDDATRAKRKQPEHDDNYCRDHLTHQTGSGGKYAMRPACSVLTLCERRFHSATHEEKLLSITDTNICSVAFFFAAAVAFVAPCMSRMIDAACQDSIMTVSLF